VLVKKTAVLVRIALSALALMLAVGWSADTPARAKILGIAYVRVRVTDLQKAKAFYGDVLGLKPGTVRSGNAVAATYVVNGNQWVELSKVAAGTKGSYLEEVAFATDDLRGLVKYLTARGVVTGEILNWPDGTPYVEIRDPEGNRVTFIEKKWGPGSDDGTAEAIGHKLLHAGFVVKDWKAENRFYENVLGFRQYWKGGFKDDGLDWYEIQVPDGDNWIEYMLNIPENADHKELGVQNHFSLGVKSADAAAKTLRQRGLKDFDGPEVGRDGKNSLDAYDPDGTRVEVMEFVPTGKVCCGEYRGEHPKGSDR
jgi:catechol 2,3-dioxygenase-like lactoylglutathione lyase family enzyme